MYNICGNNSVNIFDFLGAALPKANANHPEEKCCENGIEVDKVKIYVINRDLSNEKRFGGHIDLILPEMGLIGYYPEDSTTSTSSLVFGSNNKGRLYVGDSWNGYGHTVDFSSKKALICELWVCPEDARKMEKHAREIQNDPGIYTAAGGNCATVGCTILSKGGVMNGEISSIDNPRNLIDELRNNYGATCRKGYTYIDREKSTKDKLEIRISYR